MKNILIFCTFFALIALSSCDKRDIYFQQQQNINNEQWAYQDTLNYSFEIKDTAAIYNLFLDISHSKDYPYQNLYFIIKTTFPDGKRMSQRISYDLAEKSGKWVGEKNGSNYDFSSMLQESMFFNQTGKYIITLAQEMRESPIKGIQKVGITLENTKNRRGEQKK